MPITPYLDDFDVNAETKRVLSAALEETRISLGLGDNFADGIIALSSSTALTMNSLPRASSSTRAFESVRERRKHWFAFSNR